MRFPEINCNIFAVCPRFMGKRSAKGRERTLPPVCFPHCRYAMQTSSLPLYTNSSNTHSSVTSMLCV